MQKFETVKLGEAVEFLDAQRRPVKSSERKDGPYPYYGANGQQGTIDGYIFDERLILLAEDGGHFDNPQRGIAYLVEGKTWVNNHAHVLRASSTFLADFLCWYLKHLDVRPYITGTTRAKLTKSDASRILVPKPPLDEQQRIVDILDRAASIQRLRQAADEKLKQIIPALFVDMFGDPATVKTRWPHLTLEQVADIGSGVTKGRKLDPNEAIDVPYLRVANVQDGYLDLSEIKTITIRESEKDKYALKDGDIVMTEGGDLDKLGRGYVWEGNLPYCAHQNHVFRVRPKRELVCPYYLSAYAASPAGKDYFLRVAKRTTGIASINKTQLSALPVPVPPIALQHEFERKLNDLRSIQRLGGKATEVALLTANAASATYFSV